MLEYKTKKLKLNQIDFNNYNPNSMKDEYYQALVRNIEKDGYLQPLLINEIEGKYTIIDGEHRYKALKQLKYDTVDCWVISVPESEAKKLTLKMGLHGAYDMVQLSSLLDSLIADIDIDIPTIELDMPHIDLKEIEQFKPIEGLIETFDGTALKQKENKKIKCPHCGKEFEYGN